jgi:hypothetical protein
MTSKQFTKELEKFMKKLERFNINFIYTTSICDYYKIKILGRAPNYFPVDLTIPLPCFKGNMTNNRCYVLWVATNKEKTKVEAQFVFHANYRGTSVRTRTPERILEELGKLLPVFAYEQNQI